MENCQELPKTRAEAKVIGSKRYFTGNPCKHGHVVERYASDGACAECARVKLKSKYESDPEKGRERTRKYTDKNRQLVRHRANVKRASDPEKARAREREWNKKNPQSAKEKHIKRYAASPEKEIARSKDYYVRNSDVVKKKSRDRRRINREYNNFINSINDEETSACGVDK
jgi:hypothetical protein